MWKSHSRFNSLFNESLWLEIEWWKPNSLIFFSKKTHFLNCRGSITSYLLLIFQLSDIFVNNSRVLRDHQLASMISASLHHLSPVFKASMSTVGFKTDGTYDPLLIPHSAYAPGTTYRDTELTSRFLRSLFHDDNLTALLSAPFLNKSSPPFPTFTTRSTILDQYVFRTENRVKPVIDYLTKEVAIGTSSSIRATTSIKNLGEALSETEIAFIEGVSAVSSSSESGPGYMPTQRYKSGNPPQSRHLSEHASAVCNAITQSVAIDPVTEELPSFEIIPVNKVCNNVDVWRNIDVSNNSQSSCSSQIPYPQHSCV